MVISLLDVKRADLNYEHFFGDLFSLMFNAGKALGEAVSDEYGDGNRILVICGSGNNGGDGIIAAEMLREKNDVVLCVVRGIESMKTSESRRASRRYSGRVIDIYDLESELKKADIVIDAIFGSGITGEPKEPYKAVINSINDSGKRVVSVDVPSGMDTGVAVKPDMTVSFTDIKEGMTEENSGNIIVREIGIPEKVFNYNGPGDFVYYTLPKPESHKGMNGTVALVSGWTYYGSAVIAAKGAIKAGADLVKIYTTKANAEVLSSYSPDIIVRNIDLVDPSDELKGNNVVILGPGLGKDQDTGRIIESLKGYAGVILLDAEGLSSLESLKKACPEASFILTPHKQEFAKMSGEKATLEGVVRFARRSDCTVVLKGPRDIISDGKSVRYTEGGNARMTMGGTGDLLAGITGALSARVDNVFHSACLGSFVNKHAGSLAFKQKAFWYDIEDMIEKIPEVMKLSLGVAQT